MRSRFDLDLQNLDNGFTVLVGGEYNCGKTHLVGDALLYEKQFGEVRFCNVKGEDGFLTLAGMGLGNVGETVETYQDMLDWISDMTKLKLQAVGVDSLRPLFNAILKKIVGKDRLPDASAPSQGGDGDRSRYFWGQGRFETENVLRSLRPVAKIIVATVPTIAKEWEVTGKDRQTPDMYGAIATGCVGCFDFAGYMRAATISPTEIKRTISFQPRTDALTRQRLPGQITEDIKLVQGHGSWKLIRAAFEKGMPTEVKK